MRHPHLVLAGAGHAHLTAMTRIHHLVQAGYAVTVIGPSPFHYYSGMGPGMLAGRYSPEEIRFNVQAMTLSRGGAFLRDAVVGVAPEARTLTLASGATVAYDACSFNVGSGVSRAPGTDPVAGPEIFPVKPIENLNAARTRILELLGRSPWPSESRAPGLTRIAVVGGGPAGVEMAGAARALVERARGQATPQRPGPAITLFAGNRLLGRFPRAVRRMVLAFFTARGVEVVESCRVAQASGGRVLLEDGREFPAQIVFWATGVTPNPLFRASGLPVGPDGGLLVNEFLQGVEHPELFGGGDCIHFQPLALDKVGVHAVRQNPLLAENPRAHLEGRPLAPYNARNRYLLIFNLGDGAAVLRRGPLVLHARWAMALKSFIDRRFMRRFQRLEKPAPDA